MYTKSPNSDLCSLTFYELYTEFSIVFHFPMYIYILHYRYLFLFKKTYNVNGFCIENIYLYAIKIYIHRSRFLKIPLMRYKYIYNGPRYIWPQIYFFSLYLRQIRV